jgi:hypothetical protein
MKSNDVYCKHEVHEANKTYVDKMSVNKMTVDKMSVNEMSVDEMSVDETSIGESASQIRKLPCHRKSCSEAEFEDDFLKLDLNLAGCGLEAVDFV